MNFTVNSEMVNNVAQLTLSGSLDSASAPVFQAEIAKVAALSPKEMVLFVSELNFMASAGLRMIIFAKQKLGPSVQIFMVKPQEQILETLQMTGFIQSVQILDKYPA